MDQGKKAIQVCPIIGIPGLPWYPKSMCDSSNPSLLKRRGKNKTRFSMSKKRDSAEEGFEENQEKKPFYLRF